MPCLREVFARSFIFHCVVHDVFLTNNLSCYNNNIIIIMKSYTGYIKTIQKLKSKKS